MRPPCEFSLWFVAIDVLFGAVPNYFWRSLQYSFVQKLLLGISLPHTLAFQTSLWKCAPPVSSLSGSLPSRSLFDAVSNYYRRSLQVLVRVEAAIVDIYPTYASLSEVSLEMRPFLEFSLGFTAIEVFLWRCTELLTEVPPVFDRAEAIIGEIFPTYASIPEVSLEMRPLLEFSLGFVAIEVFL